jgi:hypothetical protein
MMTIDLMRGQGKAGEAAMYARQVGLDEFETRDFPCKVMNRIDKRVERAKRHDLR